MTSLDTQVVTTALPTLRGEFGGSVGQLEWTMNAYYLPFACLLIPAAGLGDRFGRRRILGVGLTAFGLSSVIAALAPELSTLIVARALQGGSAAAIMPLTLTVISEAYPPPGRAKAIGIWGALLGAGGVLGPILGGAVVEWVGWRGIFWINVPISVLLALVAPLLLTETYGPRHPLDLRGLALASAGCLGLAWGLVRSADQGWSDPAVWGPLLAGAGVLAAFVRTEHATAYPLMPPALFRSRQFTTANGVTIAIYASVAGGVYLMSQFFQLAQHVSPLGAALRFAPWPGPAMVVAACIGRLTDRFGNQRLVVVGMTIHATGLAWFTLVCHATTSYAVLCWPLVLSGIGIGLVFPTLSSQVVSAVAPERMGVAAGVNGSLRELGGVFGVALAATVFARTGGYATPATIATGFDRAMWACTITAIVGAGIAATTRDHVPDASQLPRSASSSSGSGCAAAATGEPLDQGWVTADEPLLLDAVAPAERDSHVTVGPAENAP